MVFSRLIINWEGNPGAAPMGDVQKLYSIGFPIMKMDSLAAVLQPVVFCRG